MLAYSGSYFGTGRTDYHRIAGLLTMFAGAMLGIVLADDLIMLFTAWELTSITSYLLIGNEHDEGRRPRRRACTRCSSPRPAGS